MLKKILRDPFVWVTVCIGLLLMVMTLYLDVNPVEGSVLNREIAGPWLQELLFFPFMPAWIAGSFLGFICD